MTDGANCINKTCSCSDAQYHDQQNNTCLERKLYLEIRFILCLVTLWLICYRDIVCCHFVCLFPKYDMIITVFFKTENSSICFTIFYNEQTYIYCFNKRF